MLPPFAIRTETMTTAPALTGREIWVRLLLYPSHTFPTAFAPVLVALGLAWRDRVLAPMPVLVGFLASWLIHVGGVFNDNHELLRRHPGVAEHPELLQALATGTLDLRTLRYATIGCFVLAFLTGPYLIGIGGGLALAIGLVGVASAYFYAGGPRPYTHLGLADPIFFLMFGHVAVVGAYYIQWADVHGIALHGLDAWQLLPRDIFVIGAPVGALVTNVMVIDDIRDRHFDASKGWRTMAVNFGLRGGRTWYLLLTVVAFVAPPLAWLGFGYPAWILLPLLTLPLALQVLQAVWTRDTTRELLMMTPRASYLSMLFGGLLGAALALGGR